MVKKGLGRGFESLIPTDLLDESFDPTAGDDRKVSELRHIKLSEIEGNPDQPRRIFDETALGELAESIKQHGVLQPIVLTPKGGGYEIIAGERRYRAAKIAGLRTIPALVRTTTAQRKLELALIENLQRKNLNPLETATAYGKLREQFNMSLEEIGVSVGGQSVSAISNKLRLLKLPKEVQTAIVDNKISEGQARPLIDMDPEFALELLPRIIAEGWSARKVEAAARESKQKGSVTERSLAQATQYKDEARQIGERFHTTVRVKTSSRGSGQIVFSFATPDEFAALKERLLP